MINKQSSNDEVLHHLKQMELMLMSAEEEKGLRRILEIQDILGCPKVEHWLDDGIFSSSWLEGTNNLLTDVKNKLLKNFVIQEHLAQCRGFVAYNILLAKLENNDMVLMYQNGEWIFAFLNERKEQEAWVNQRFNSCFFNTSYEKKFLELVKETPRIEINRAWLFARETWFYTTDLFEELNVVFNKLTFEDIDKAKPVSLNVFDEEMPPLDEEVKATIETVSTQESIQVEVAPSVALAQEVIALAVAQDVAVVDVIKPVEVAKHLSAPMPAPLKSKAKIEDNPFGEDDVPFVPDEEDMPPLDDVNEFDLFQPVAGATKGDNEVNPVKEVKAEVQSVFVDTQAEPIEVDFGFDENTSTGEVLDSKNEVVAEKSNEVAKSQVEVPPVISNKGISLSPIPEKKVIQEKKPAAPPASAPTKPRVVFGSKRNVAETSVAPAPAPAVAPAKKGFSVSLGGKSINPAVISDSPFGEDGSENDED